MSFSAGKVASAAAAANTMDSAASIAGATGVNAPLSNQKDAQESSTEPKFGDVFKQIQAKYGAKPEKQREIKKTLGKDDFLRIMITQMQHQDPTNPFKAEQMAQEMAQFTSVEQFQNMNQTLNKISTQNQPLERLAMTNLIGKTVTVDKDRFPHTEGSNESLSFKLPRDATDVKVALVSENGEVVLEKDIGAQKAGEGTFLWDGLKSNKLPAKGGTYMLRVEAKDERGAAIQIDSRAKSKVVGVSFEAGEPVLLVGDGKRQDKITMKNVVRIDSDGFSAPSPAAGQGALAAPATSGDSASTGGSNFFTFKKGEGSSNMDVSQADPHVAAAINRFQAGQNVAQGAAAKPVAGAASARPEEKGFPNGLSGN